MVKDLIHDRGRGPEIIGTRITVYNLLPYLLDPAATEDYVCRLYDLNPEQVAAARAYVLNNADVVLAEHMQIEARMNAGNPPEVIEAARRTHARLVQFKEWLGAQERSEAKSDASQSQGNCLKSDRPTFREWVASGGDREADDC
jgi:uncharacterized protein (DUF433 family)